MAALIFAATAVVPEYALASLLCYASGLATDALDGLVARRWHVASPAGAAYDGFADKAMTVVSALYGVAIGAPLVACAVVIMRDVLVLSFRAIAGERIVMIPSRINGMATGAPLKLLTILILAGRYIGYENVPLYLYWVPASVTAISVGREIWTNRAVLRKYFRHNVSHF